MTDKVTIQIYKVTSKQLFFKVPSKICEECDLLVNMTEKVVDEINDNRIKIETMVKQLALSDFKTSTASSHSIDKWGGFFTRNDSR